MQKRRALRREVKEGTRQSVVTRRLTVVARRETGAVDVRELQEHTRDVLRRVEEGGEIIDVADGGRVVARMIPVPPRVDPAVHQAIWERRRKLAEEIGKHWKDDVTAAEAVAEGRREL
jgi:antitoxin (DNA-binding transcriptional repressor) of toxin-antitoxin stability system